MLNYIHEDFMPWYKQTHNLSLTLDLIIPDKKRYHDLLLILTQHFASATPKKSHSIAQAIQRIHNNECLL